MLKASDYIYLIKFKFLFIFKYCIMQTNLGLSEGFEPHKISGSTLAF